jgi:hypothetical protein
VFYCPGDLTLRSPATITTLVVPPTVVVNGTLVVDGALRFGTNGEVAGLAQTIEVTPVSGMPAVVCRGEIQFAGNKKTVTVNGLVHVVNGIFNTMASIDTTPSTFNVNGAVMAENASSNTFGSAAMPLTIKYDATKLNVVDFSTASNQAVTNVAVLEVR